MPIQILPALKKQKSYGEILGTGLGEGLSALLNHKVGEMQSKKKADAWRSIGFSNEESNFIMSQPESIQKELIKNIERSNSGEGESSSPSLRLFGSGATAKAENKEDLKVRNDFLLKSRKRYDAASDVGSLANKTLDYLKENKDNLPGFPSRLINQKYNPWASNAVRKLDADYKKIISKVAALEAAGVSSRLTNQMLRLAEESKSAIDQPYEVQVELLEDLIDIQKKAEKEQKQILDIKKAHGGRYPHDIQDIITASKIEGSAQDEQSDRPYIENGILYVNGQPVARAKG